MANVWESIETFNSHVIEFFGVKTWDYIHCIALSYPNAPTDECRAETNILVHAVMKEMRCPPCKIHALAYLAAHPPDLENRITFFIWTCEFHNHVNSRQGKASMTVADAFAVHSKHRSASHASETSALHILAALTRPKTTTTIPPLTNRWFAELILGLVMFMLTLIMYCVHIVLSGSQFEIEKEDTDNVNDDNDINDNDNDQAQCETK